MATNKLKISDLKTKTLLWFDKFVYTFEELREKYSRMAMFCCDANIKNNEVHYVMNESNENKTTMDLFYRDMKNNIIKVI